MALKLWGLLPIHFGQDHGLACAARPYGPLIC